MGGFVSYRNQAIEECAEFVYALGVESREVGREIIPIKVVVAKDVDYIFEEESVEVSGKSAGFGGHTFVGIFDDGFLQHEVAVGVLCVEVIVAEVGFQYAMYEETSPFFERLDVCAANLAKFCVGKGMEHIGAGLIESVQMSWTWFILFCGQRVNYYLSEGLIVSLTFLMTLGVSDCRSSSE